MDFSLDRGLIFFSTELNHNFLATLLLLKEASDWLWENN